MKLRPIQLALAVVLCFPISMTIASDWPTYRHSPDRSGTTSEQLQMPLTLRWIQSAPTKPRLAWAGPDNRIFEGHELRHRMDFDETFQVAIVGGRVYFGSSVDHQVHCHDLATGKERWHFYTGGPVRLAPTVWNGKVYFGSDDGSVYCVDAISGQLQWKLRAGPEDEWFIGRGDMISRWPVRTGVTIYDGIAYFGAGIFPHENIYLYAVDAQNGKVVWKRDDISQDDAGRNAITPQGYLLVNDGYIFIPSGRALPACFDRKTGNLLHHRSFSWRKEGVIGGTRAILTDKDIYAAGPHQMIGLDQKTGNISLGTVDCKEMIVDGTEAYTLTGKKIRRLDRAGYAEAVKAQQRLRDTITSLGKKLAKAKDAEKLKEQIDGLIKDLSKIQDQGVIWSADTQAESALLATANLIFAGGRDRVDAYDKSTGKHVWSAPVDGEASGLAAANGFLLVSTSNGKVYAFADAAQPQAQAVVQGEYSKRPYPDDNDTRMYELAAEQILKQTDIREGYCLVLGAEQGRLAFELAKRSRLRVYGIEPDAEKVHKAREALRRAGYYGHRVTIHQADLADIPYSNYFANLVVSDSFLLTGKLPGNPRDIIRHVKPLGGAVCFGAPAQAGIKMDPGQIGKWLEEMSFGEAGKIDAHDGYVMYVRGKLHGADNWSHQYGEPGNTAANMDQRIKGGMGVLWYGDPGPGQMVNRHDGAVGPVSVAGRLIVQGQFSVLAYDAYNGLFLWEHKNPETYRTGVFQNQNASNLLASETSVFVMEGKDVVELDIATGKLKARHQLPSAYRKNHEWGYIAYNEGRLIGAATVRKELAAALKRRGRKFEDATDALFAIDVATGKHLWTYQGQNISAQTVALGPGRVYFIDSSISSEERAALLRRDREELKKLTGEAAKIAEERLKKQDVRMAIALDAATGQGIWAKPVDVTDCSEIGAGGGKLTLMYKDDVLVLCGANANGHYWKQFVEGEFKRRRLVALSAKDGEKLWAKDANYRHRPIIIESKIIAEPWAFDLHTGEQIMRKHPLTGEEVPWSIYRPGHHCGMITGAPNMLLFRSGFTGFYDLYGDSGTQHFAGHRLGCWINAIPANGLVMIPEASAGCLCQFSIASTITLEPREPRNSWAIYSAVGDKTPVQRLALNLGAPGDRKDARGQVWLAYPRPNPLRKSTLELRLNLKESLAKGGAFESINEQSVELAASEAPEWIYTSWAKGLLRCELPLLGKKDSPTDYTVRLHFADLIEDAKPGARVFDVKLQGKTVLENFDPASAGDSGKTIVREFPGVRVDQSLMIELVPRTDRPEMRRLPILNAIEVFRTK